MIFPVRCFTCGKVVGGKWERFKFLTLTMSMQDALDLLGIKRYCCRQIFLCHVDLLDELLKYREENKISANK
jgi:DNA-directed RNA polymerase I, II, and III subunit RPABC5